MFPNLVKSLFNVNNSVDNNVKMRATVSSFNKSNTNSNFYGITKDNCIEENYDENENDEEFSKGENYNYENNDNEEEQQCVALYQPLIDKKVAFVNQLISRLKSRLNLNNDDINGHVYNTLHAKEVFKTLGTTSISYIQSGSTGHAFKGIIDGKKDSEIAIKVTYYPKMRELGRFKDKGRPENIELRMVRTLSRIVTELKCNPHFVVHIFSFFSDIEYFIELAKYINLNDKKNHNYANFIKSYHMKTLYPFVSVIIGEWCTGKNLYEYIAHNWERMLPKEYIVAIFQILYSLAQVHSIDPTWIHNDLKMNNVLVQIIRTDDGKPLEGNFLYVIRDRYQSQYKYYFSIPNVGFQIKIWDFDFANIQGKLDNNKVHNDWADSQCIGKNCNRYYDMHYFFNSMFDDGFLGKLFNNSNWEIHKNIVKLYHDIVPERFRGGDLSREHRMKELEKGMKTNPTLNRYFDSKGNFNIKDEELMMLTNYPEVFEYINEKNNPSIEKGEYVHYNRRLAIDEEYTTPFKIITEHKFFKAYFINVEREGDIYESPFSIGFKSQQMKEQAFGLNQTNGKTPIINPNISSNKSQLQQTNNSLNQQVKQSNEIIIKNHMIDFSSRIEKDKKESIDYYKKLKKDIEDRKKVMMNKNNLKQEKERKYKLNGADVKMI